VVDGLVNLNRADRVFVSSSSGSSTITSSTGRQRPGKRDDRQRIAPGRLQTGKLYHYVFVLAGGALLIFLIKAF